MKLPDLLDPDYYGGTLFAADKLAEIGATPEQADAMSSKLPDSVHTTLRSSFPMRIEGATLELVEYEAEPDGRLRLTVRMLVFSGEEILDIKEQEVVVEGGEGPLKSTLSTAKQRSSQYGADILPVLMPVDFFRVLAEYRPVGPFEEDSLWSQNVCLAILQQAEQEGFERRFEILDDWPPEPRHVYFAYLLGAMVGGSGLEVFLHQAKVDAVMGGLEALDALGCKALAGLYRQALGKAAGESAEFLIWVDEDWLEREQSVPPEGSWDQIDSWEADGTWKLLETELEPRLDAYLQAHRASLVRG